ncbi:WD40/YVTN repeat-like-containing domain-containing protein [Artemisia annua]|uniref:WD40/YVTN repeat-like-containing domain-containing protein n=1 Tax=Artemisia annua TaxID=35608 RepID=A0A2U1NMD0_ARTAN|nr:WD40/YVTN repeat-like-containing domain-containing protein [Artemisia annua]
MANNGKGKSIYIGTEEEEWDKEQYDTHDPKGYSLFLLPFLMKRSKGIEIVAAHGIVFALAVSGVCAAFSIV